MNDNKIYTLGLIPAITQVDLDKLNDAGQQVIARELGISERTLRYRLASFRDAGIAVGGGRR